MDFSAFQAEDWMIQNEEIRSFGRLGSRSAPPALPPPAHRVIYPYPFSGKRTSTKSGAEFKRFFPCRGENALTLERGARAHLPNLLIVLTLKFKPRKPSPSGVPVGAATRWGSVLTSNALHKKKKTYKKTG